MRVYKEKQFLIFDFEDGKSVKYDFATKQAIGKNGLPVKDLKTQLRGYTIQDICECCDDKQYGNFLKFIQEKNSTYGIKNIGTILEMVPKYSHLEQIFSSGIEGIIDRDFKYSINDIPKGLIKICKTHGIKLSNSFLEFYKELPEAHQIAYELDYISINKKDLDNIFTSSTIVRTPPYRFVRKSKFNHLIKEYGYNAKHLLLYLDYLKTFEAIECLESFLGELIDYCYMMKKISDKFDRYPRNFLTTHRIASRNYARMKASFDENVFKNRINPGMEHRFGSYVFIYPKSTQEIKDEAVAQNNCVASYIQKVLDGQCDILFLRKASDPDKSLVTIEVQNGKIVQAREKYNNPVSADEEAAIQDWNKWYFNKTTKEKMKNVS